MADSTSYEKDVESGKHPIISEEKQRSSVVKRGSVTPEAEVARAQYIQNAWAPFRYMSKAEMWLDEKLGIETQGIDRIPEEEKRPPHIMNTFLMWWSMTCHVGTLPIGILGPIYGLDLHQSVACIIGGNFLGAMCTAYTGTLGPKVGSIPGLESDFANSSIPRPASVKSLPLDTHLVSTAQNFARYSTWSSTPVSPSSMSWSAVRSFRRFPTIP
jgi:hypothetical protein